MELSKFDMNNWNRYLIAIIYSLFTFIYPNNTRDVYLYIYWVSAYMG